MYYFKQQKVIRGNLFTSGICMSSKGHPTSRTMRWTKAGGMDGQDQQDRQDRRADQGTSGEILSPSVEFIYILITVLWKSDECVAVCGDCVKENQPGSSIKCTDKRCSSMNESHR